MKNTFNKILLMTILFIPTVLFASSDFDSMPITVILSIEAFVSIHMSIFVLWPISKIISKENNKKTFLKLFIARICILLFFDFFITKSIAIIDFFAVFLGAFIVVPIMHIITKKRENTNNSTTNISTPTNTSQALGGIELRCAKCNAIFQITDKFCTNCGEAFDGNNVVVKENGKGVIKTPPKERVLSYSFDFMYRLSEDEMLTEYINRQMKSIGLDSSLNLVPKEIIKRKNIMNIIFSLLVFVYISIIFFHFPLLTYVIGLILLIIFFKVTRGYDLMKFLKKQIKSRPSEKISNIIMSIKNNLEEDNTKKPFSIYLVVAFIAPLIIFSTPKIIYEQTEGGYAVRYYIFGLTNFKTASIPENYKDGKVVSLRGNTFSNMPLLEEVSLPDTIVEIRGEAFKNCRKLSKVNIPKRLEYLGGGAFYNAKSIIRIELPNTLTYLGGESFYGASSLEYIKLSNRLTEIRGDSFEYCTSLKSIAIPDSVTRIGGHAFYGDRSLSEVSISENSRLGEIGSSAFRRCSSLRNISLPRSTSVNSKAFKESPTVIYRYGKYYRN